MFIYYYFNDIYTNVKTQAKELTNFVYNVYSLTLIIDMFISLKITHLCFIISNYERMCSDENQPRGNKKNRLAFTFGS